MAVYISNSSQRESDSSVPNFRKLKSLKPNWGWGRGWAGWAVLKFNPKGAYKSTKRTK